MTQHVFLYRGRMFRLILFVMVSMVSFATPVVADPPAWAPAHGYYKEKKIPHYRPGQRRPYYRSDREHDLLPWLVGGSTAGYIIGDRCNREGLGALLGGIIGGVAGAEIANGDHREVAIVAGTLIGVLVGKSIGRAMDQADSYCTGQALEYARDRQTIEWSNPAADARYQVTPMNYYESRDGRYCREFITEVTIAGQRQRTYGTACRQADGSWRVVD